MLAEQPIAKMTPPLPEQSSDELWRLEQQDEELVTQLLDSVLKNCEGTRRLQKQLKPSMSAAQLEIFELCDQVTLVTELCEIIQEQDDAIRQLKRSS